MHDLVTLVTIKEAARRLGVPYSTAHKYVGEYKVPTTRNGNYRFVDPEAIRAVLPAHLLRKQHARKA